MTNKRRITPIKISSGTRDRLKKLKRGGESYDELLKRKMLSKKRR